MPAYPSPSALRHAHPRVFSATCYKSTPNCPISSSFAAILASLHLLHTCYTPALYLLHTCYHLLHAARLLVVSLLLRRDHAGGKYMLMA